MWAVTDRDPYLLSQGSLSLTEDYAVTTISITPIGLIGEDENNFRLPLKGFDSHTVDLPRYRRRFYFWPDSSAGAISRIGGTNTMGVPTIALYATSPSSVCAASHQIGFHVSYDSDVNGRSASSAASSSPLQKPSVGGGLSCLFPSPQVRSASCSIGGDDSGSIWHDKSEELGSSLRFSSLSSSFKREQGHQSPVSVLQGLGSAVGFGSRTSPHMRLDAEFVRSGTGGLFNGFVRHACVDYNNSSSHLQDFDLPFPSTALPLDDLTFNMDDESVELESPAYAKDLLHSLQSKHTIFKDSLVVKAFYAAEKAHRGQKRVSGHPYLDHCVETAVLLANIGSNSTVVAAGLLHDTVDDTFFTFDIISQSFGAEVSDLVQGVSKLSQLSKLARENNTASKTTEAEMLHTMFLAMADARAVLIKLADRLHNMMTLDVLPLIKQQRIAKETLEIFAPLASRLGISLWKEQLENLCFKYLYPDHYEELSSKLLIESCDEVVVSSSLAKLEEALKGSEVDFHCLCGRHKSLYSIYCKMLKKKLSMDEIHDIHGLRLIVENEEDCYKALKVVQTLWNEVPGRFKDYIIHPKFNGYQSLHTVVESEGMIPLEVQIRTKEMHLQAEYGFAAHWRYKEGRKHPSFILQMVEWARWVISWHCERISKEGTSFVDTVKPPPPPPCTFPTHSRDCSFSRKADDDGNGPIFIILLDKDKVRSLFSIGDGTDDKYFETHPSFLVDQMSVQEFPMGSSMMDLLETMGRGSCIAKEELRPQVNHEAVVDPGCKLRMGDVVELTPAIPYKSLTVYREEIQRMYDRGLQSSSSSSSVAATAT
ncbi:hypothetical protein M569_06094 [Genlisea aurea]|uniref:GTP diphosphokinase n=1 Tax=Genlisea aurea TaxID=192259 RepID=S8E886_9LAMI|nr:hypothetical protein M569_06094 [Genlisea aurea]